MTVATGSSHHGWLATITQLMLKPGHVIFFFLGEGVRKSVFLSPGGLEHSKYSEWTTLLFTVRNSAPVITACLWPYRKSTLIKVFFRPDANVQRGRADYARDSIIASLKTANINKRGQEIFLDFRVKIRNPRATKYPFKFQSVKFGKVCCMWKNCLSLVRPMLSLLFSLYTHV